jgi:hypothetical protein
MTAAPPDLSPAASALQRQRQAALLAKFRDGKASRSEIEELYASPDLAALLPPRPAAPAPAAPLTPPPPSLVPAAYLRRALPYQERDRLEVAAFIDRIFAQHSRIDLPPPISPWIRENVILSAEESKQFPGYYDPELSPVCTILFDFIQSPYWKEFICVKPSQIGMTLAFLGALMHKIRFAPRDVAMVINNREEIQRIGINRLQPMLRACAAIAQRIPADKDKLQNMTLYLVGLTIYLLGGQSVGGLANKSLDWCELDEVDETPEEMRGGESTAVDLARDRLKRQEGSKLFVISKPRNEDDIIWPEYLHGSRHRVFVPCPHCSGALPPQATDDSARLFDRLPQPLPPGYQVLVRAGLRYQHCRRENSRQWDLDLILTDTYYECLWCHGRIEDRHKSWMLRHRLYLPTNTPHGALQDDCITFRTDRDPTETDSDSGHPQPVPRKLSFQCSDLYALAHQPDSTFGNLAVEIVTATNLSKQRKFRRSREGLPVQRVLSDNGRTLAQILALQGRFARGHCSRVPLAILMGVDTQHYGRKWVKAAFFEDDSCELLDYGIVFKGFDGLIPEAEKPIIIDDWQDIPEPDRLPPVVDSAWIDEGDGAFTKRVLAFCASPGARRLFWPAKGRGGSQTASMPDLVTMQAKNRYDKVSLPRYLFNADAFHEELYDERIGRAAEIATALANHLAPPIGQLRLFSNPDTDLCLEFTSKRRWTEEDAKAHATAKRKPGTRRSKVLKVGDWFRDGGPEDFADAFLMCLAQWYKLRPRGTSSSLTNHTESAESEPESED